MAIVTSGLIFDLRAAYANGGTGPHTDNSANGPWADLSGNSRNGTLQNFTGSTTIGWQGSGGGGDPFCLVAAGEAEGSNYDMVDMGDLSAYDLTSLTIEVWLKTTDTGALRGVLDNIVNSEGYMLDLGAADADQGKPRFVTGNGAPNTEMRGSSKVNDGSWHHVVCTYDAATTTGKVYIDNGTPASNSSMETPTAPAAGSLKLFGDGLSTYRMAGAIAQCRLYNRALSSTEVGDNYAAGPDAPLGSSAAVGVATERDVALGILATKWQKEYSGRITTDDGSSVDWNTAAGRARWATLNSGSVAITGGELQITASNTSTEHARRKIVDDTTKGDLFLGLTDAVICFDLHNASANNGSFYVTLWQDATHSYGLVIPATALGTCATQKNGSNQQTASKGCANGATIRVKFYRVGSTIGAIVDGVVLTTFTDSANAGPFELRFGAPNNGSGTSDWRLDNLDVCVANTHVVRNVPTGGAVRLYNSGGTTLASAAESGGTATLDLSGLTFPITGYLQVFTDSYTTPAGEFGRFPGVGTVADLRGGDRFVYDSHGYAVVGPEFIALYATTQADSHGQAVTDPVTGETIGLSYGPGGSVLSWWGNLTLESFNTYEIEPVGSIIDQHAASAIQVMPETAAGAGKFHIIYGDTPKYRESTLPWKADSWGSSEYVDGAGTGSFDGGLLIDQDGYLYLLGVTPWATGGNSIFCKKKAPGGSWGATQTIATAVFPYTYYLSDVAIGKESSGQKSLWLTAFVHDGSSTYQDCIVIRSTDGATNWKGITGSNFSLPLTCPSGVLSDSNGIAHSGTNSYIARLCIDVDGSHVHLAMWDLSAGYPKYKRGTIGTGWASFSQNLSSVNTHGAMEQTDDGDLVYVAAGPSPNRLIMYASGDGGVSWAGPFTLISFVPSTSPPQPYWVKLTPVLGTRRVVALVQSRYTTYQAGTSNVSGEGVASLFAVTIDVPQVIAAGNASETDSGLGVVSATTTTVGVGSETDSGLAITPDLGAPPQTVTIGVAAEADSGLQIFPIGSDPQSQNVGLASETDTALAVGIPGRFTMNMQLPPGTVLGAYLRHEWIGAEVPMRGAGSYPGPVVQEVTVDDYGEAEFMLEPGSYIAWAEDFPQRRRFFVVTAD